MSFFSRIFRFGSSGLNESSGVQIESPSTSLVEETPSLSIDAALQISALWRCVELLSSTISTLPLMIYQDMGKGKRNLARESALWSLLHESPNGRMTPCEFWMAIIVNLALRNNGYARIERDQKGEAYAMWPMASDQVETVVMESGEVVYHYRIGSDLAVLAAENVLHIKGMGNGTVGLSKLDYMKATTNEIKNSQNAANKLFSTSGKPTGVLMVDSILKKEQREAIQRNFAEMATGSTARLYVLEANMKYQQITLSPEDMQLLQSRKFSIEEIGRWFGVPSVLINHSDVTAWGEGIYEIIEGFHKFTIRPALVNIEQAIRKRVFSSAQRVKYTAEFNFDGLLRASLKDRMDIYAKAVQNGLKTRNECRQLENDEPIAGGDELTAQTNLVPINMLGKIQNGGGNVPQDPILQ